MADLSELIAKVNRKRETSSARLTGEEAQKALDALHERELMGKLAEQAAKEAGQPEAPSDLRKSSMSASAKSRYIQEFGIDRYKQLPE